MIQLNKYGSSYNFDLKGHKIATFKNWVELQAWAECIPKGCRDPKTKINNKFINLVKFKSDEYAKKQFESIQRSQLQDQSNV